MLIRHILIVGFLGAAVVFSASFVTEPPTSETPPAPVVSTETDIEVPDCFAGVKRDLVIRLNNQSDKPVRVLGMNRC